MDLSAMYLLQRCAPLASTPPVRSKRWFKTSGEKTITCSSTRGDLSEKQGGAVAPTSTGPVDAAIATRAPGRAEVSQGRREMVEPGVGAQPLEWLLESRVGGTGLAQGCPTPLQSSSSTLHNFRSHTEADEEELNFPSPRRDVVIIAMLDTGNVFKISSALALYCQHFTSNFWFESRGS